MNRMFRLSLLVVVLLLFAGRSNPSQAQEFRLDHRGFSYVDPVPAHRTAGTGKIRLAHHRASRRKTYSSGRRNARRAGRWQRKARKKRFSKRRKGKIASLGRRKSGPRQGRATSVEKINGPVQIVVSLPRQRVNIYKGSRVIASARVSTGRSGYATPPGVFSIIQKRRTHFSNLYDNAPMPFMQRITWSGLALHAGNVSRPYASHGCIRMPYGFARKLFRRTSMGAHVIVANGPVSPKPVSHKNLFQPLSKDGVQLAGYTAKEGLRDSDAPSATGGIAGFVPGIERARRSLKKKQQELETLLSGLPVLQKTREEALQQVQARRQAHNEAFREARETKRQLYKPRLTVARLKKAVNVRQRQVKKAERRAEWARDIVEKRRDNPKYAGKWMTGALARIDKREARLEEAREKLDAATSKLDEAIRAYEILKEKERKAAARLVDETRALREARERLKKATGDLARGESDIKKARRALKAAQKEIEAARAREKMPLRILVTPLSGRERVRVVQEMLSELGHDSGIADGKAGRKTRAAIRAFQRETGQEQTGKITDGLVDALYARTGRTMRGNAHMYVRQGFRELFDVPVTIRDPEKPLGTHVFTAMHFSRGARNVEWTTLSLNNRARKKGKRGKRGRNRTANAGISPKEVLDRLDLPANVRRQISLLLTPGSSMVVSDRGMSHETGKGTDFVVLTR